MPDPLHPAAPVVPAAPAEPVRNPSPSFGELLALLDGPSPPILKAPLSPDFYAGPLGVPAVELVGANGWTAQFPLLVDVAEPDAPAPVGDRVPCHLFWAPPADPLPPVLRRDRAPVVHRVGVTDPARVLLEVPDGLGLQPFDPARLAAWQAPPPPPPRRSWLRRLWDDHHEWITVGAILVVAAAALLHAHAAKAAVVVVPRVVIVPRVVVPPRPAPARPAPAPARQPEAAPRAPVVVPVIPAAPACSQERRARREC